MVNIFFVPGPGVWAPGRGNLHDRPLHLRRGQHRVAEAVQHGAPPVLQQHPLRPEDPRYNPTVCVSPDSQSGNGILAGNIILSSSTSSWHFSSYSLLILSRFWSSAPHLESQSQVFLKSALHINIANLALVGDDGLVTQSSSGCVHSLDSNYTTDKLRSVHSKEDSKRMQYTIDMLRSTVKQWSLDVMGFFLLCLSCQADVWTFSISSNNDKLCIQHIHHVLVISGTGQQGLCLGLI